MRQINTPVLIIGNGPAGGAMALALSTYGIDNINITRYRWIANSPRAHITNQRVMEFLRDMGCEQEALSVAVPQDLLGTNVFCTAITGEELGRLRSWGTHPSRQADYKAASPCPLVDIPQTYMEPVLLSNASKRGSQTLLHTEYVSHVQDGDGVTTLLRDRLSGEEFEIRSKYLIGADGARSKVAEDIKLPMKGQMAIAGSMNILFDADLTQYVQDRPSVLYWVLQPGCNIGGIGMGLIRMIRPWKEWMLVWGYDINQPAPEVSEEEAAELVRKIVGASLPDLKIKSISTWTNNEMYAEEISRGRVFCMGDAIHRHPPSNGLGSNTSIQDAYNLAWKMAMVLKGQAKPKLLDSYNAERAPVAKQIVTRANKSTREFGKIFEALGLMDTQDPNVMNQNIASRKEKTPQGKATRKALRNALNHKNYEFNAHGVELGQRYRSDAVVSDGSPEPEYTRDPELYYHPTTWPGAHLPHAWVNHNNIEVSTYDLGGKGKFALFTGIGGEAWVDAAKKAAEQYGIDIQTYVFGPGQDVEDLWGDWDKLCEIEEDGMLLIRPDMFIAYRAKSLAPDPNTALTQALGKILGHEMA